jgi:hypothetical protein
VKQLAVHSALLELSNLEHCVMLREKLAFHWVTSQKLNVAKRKLLLSCSTQYVMRSDFNFQSF